MVSHEIFAALSPRGTGGALQQPLLASFAAAVECECADPAATTVFPAVEGHELAVIRAKEQLLVDAGWGSSGVVCASPAEASLAGDAVTALPLHPSTRIKCKNCSGWFAVSERVVGAVPVDTSSTAPISSASHQLLSPRSNEFRCRWHHGTYRPGGTTVSSGICIGWSCCKARDQDAPGCNLRLHHVEDCATTGRPAVLQCPNRHCA